MKLKRPQLAFQAVDGTTSWVSLEGAEQPGSPGVLAVYVSSG